MSIGDVPSVTGRAYLGHMISIVSAYDGCGFSFDIMVGSRRGCSWRQGSVRLRIVVLLEPAMKG